MSEVQKKFKVSVKEKTGVGYRSKRLRVRAHRFVAEEGMLKKVKQFIGMEPEVFKDKQGKVTRIEFGRDDALVICYVGDWIVNVKGLFFVYSEKEFNILYGLE